MNFDLVLRIMLLVGLGVHKLVWEVLKRNDVPIPTRRETDVKPLSKLVKLFKIAALAGIIGQTLLLPDFPPITDDPDPLRIIGSAVFVAGLSIAIIGRLQLGDNWANLEDYQILANQSLVTTGVYGYIRHPIYTGDILLLLGLELALNSWLVIGILPLAIVVMRQVKAEEAILAQSFPNYGSYSQRTKMFIPYIL